MVVNLKAAYRLRIENLDWMSAPTKREALQKLDTYTIKVGYPDHPRDYSALRIDPHDLVGNVRRSAAADWAFYSGRYAGPVDRSDWIMTPQTNDAYNGSLRDIVFPAGILQAPIFDPHADAAINYGAAGGVIGHELTHGFDDEGRTIDASGALRDWWTAADADAFKARAAKLGAEYAQFEPFPGAKVNPDLTMGENIADLGGVTLALDAYRASLHGQPAPVLDGFSGDQRVFLGWAQAWRGKAREDYIRNQVVSDPHAPGSIAAARRSAISTRGTRRFTSRPAIRCTSHPSSARASGESARRLSWQRGVSYTEELDVSVWHDHVTYSGIGCYYSSGY